MADEKSDFTFTLKAIADQFDAAMIRSETRFKKLADAAGKTNKTMSEGTGIATGVGNAMKNIAISMIGISSGTDLIQKGIGLLKEYKAQLDAIGEVSRTQADKLRSFYSILPLGPEGKAAAKSYMTQGAGEFGLTPEQTASLIEPIVSALNAGDLQIIDKDEQAKISGAFVAAAKAVFIGVPPLEAGRTEVSGATRGMVPGLATAQMLQAASMSSYSKEQFAQLVPSTAYYTGKGQFADALALAGAMSQTFTDSGRVPELMKGAARILTAQGDKRKLVRKLGLDDTADITERLTKLREYALREGKGETEEERIASGTQKFYQMARGGGGTTAEQQNVDSISGEAIAVLVQNYGKFVEMQKAISAITSPELVDTTFQELMAFAGQSAAMKEKQAIALAQLSAFMGPAAGAAEEETARRYAIGAERIAGGGALGYEAATGKASAWGRSMEFGWNVLEAAGRWGSPGGPGIPESAPEYVSNLDRLDQSITALKTAIENTPIPKALQENTDALLQTSAGTPTRNGNIE